ncbi:MAG: asparaginase, partial [Candidatus Eremiobacteraeota bacterium]|nr:asparaginase [Candidatus Eremiobacteraeota bacterium]
TRGDLVESVHGVAACAVDARGITLYEAGDVDAPVYLRSAAKPFIAAAVLESGAGERFGFDAREIAVMSGSHTGEPFHVDAVRSMLKKIGMDASALQCGVHWPYDEAATNALRREGQEPTVLHNNCSGKHAGILALCKAIGADTATYLLADNPAERRILDYCARLSDDDAASWPVGTDGCGIPVYATSLKNAALSFARMASLRGIGERDATALRAVREAMVAHPEYVAGTNQFDTELMTAAGGNVAAKAGAEGVHGAAAIAQGLGYVSKVLDGGARARGPSTIAVLRGLGVLSATQAAALGRFGAPSVYNRAGRLVGEIRVSPGAVEKANV